MTIFNFGSFRKAYRIKQLTDTSFYATIVAIKCALFALAVIAVMVFAFKDSDSQSRRARPAPKMPTLDVGAP